MDDIGSWLTALGLERYIERFEREGIDLQSLALLTDRDLVEMGVALGPRRRILNAIGPPQPLRLAGPTGTNITAAERRPLTILFCDMVASTEYADRLDPEDFSALMRRFLETCSAVIQRNNGLVASYIGDAIKVYFGYPVAGEDDTERALLAGLEILKAVAGITDPQGQPLRVRLGVASGEVVVGSFVGPTAGLSIEAFGHVVHRAARLQTLAEPNTILADTATFQAAYGAIEFAEFGRHALKGFSEPVYVWQARQARSLPSRFARRPQLTRLYGRDHELRQLMTCWDEVTAGRRAQIVVISGEAGIGKSRLLHELQQRVRISNQLLVQCSPSFDNSTLHPFLRELMRHAGAADTDTADDQLRKLSAALSDSEVPLRTSLPIIASLLSIPTADPDNVADISSEHHRTITKNIFTNWIGRLAREAPLLLLFEDEQWADRTSRELLDVLIEGLPSIPALILVSTRTENQTMLSNRRDLLHLKLKPLGPNDATAIIREMSSTNLPSKEVVAFVLDRAEGVPLYIEELARSALELGLIINSSIPRGEATDGGIPSSLQSSLLARLDRLGPAREVAQIAATIGRDFSLELLREVSGLPDTEVKASLTNLVDAGLILPNEGPSGSDYTFKHALLQQAAQRTILRERNQQLHVLIGRTMEARDPEASSKYPEILAQHFADGGLFDRAADYWLLAGLKAGKTWAKVEAARLFEKGIEAASMLPESAERSRRIIRLELERGDVLYAAFGYGTGESTAAYHRAIRLSEELGDLEAPIRALDGLFGTHFNSGQFADAIGASDRLIDIGERRNNLKALVLGLQFKGMSLFCRGQFASARFHLERALDHRASAREVGSDFPSMAVIYLAWTMQILGYHEEALDLFQDAHASVRHESAYRLAACLGDGCILFAFREDSATIAELTEELLPLAQENGFNLWAKMASFFRGWTMADIDQSLAGTALMRDTLDSLEDQEVDKSCFFGLLAKACLKTGQLEEALGAIKQGLDQANKIGEHYFTAELLRIRGEVELCSGIDPSSAAASFREAIAFAQGQAAKSWELKATESLARLLPSRSASWGRDPQVDLRAG